MFVAYGNPDTGDPNDAKGAKQIAEERGYEVVLDVQYPLDISDWGPIAAQVRDADPDFVYLGALGVDGPNLIAALDALNYQPAGMFMQWPAPGPVLGAGESAEGVLSVTAFESHPPFTAMVRQVVCWAGGNKSYQMGRPALLGGWRPSAGCQGAGSPITSRPWNNGQDDLGEYTYGTESSYYATCA